MCLLYLFLIKIPMLGWQEQHIHYYGRLAFAYSLNHTLIRVQRMKSNTKKLFQRTICFGNASIFFSVWIFCFCVMILYICRPRLVAKPHCSFGLRRMECKEKISPLYLVFMSVYCSVLWKNIHIYIISLVLLTQSDTVRRLLETEDRKSCPFTNNIYTRIIKRTNIVHPISFLWKFRYKESIFHACYWMFNYWTFFKEFSFRINLFCLKWSIV